MLENNKNLIGQIRVPNGSEKEWKNFSDRIDKKIEDLNPSTITLVTDSNVEKLVLPSLKDSMFLNKADRVVVEPGEAHKNLKTIERIWNSLEDTGATRKSLIINLGGGLITDVGGFAAATFKRGIPYINIPTTLLGAVDAASGGKTGINYRGLKNEIGAFHQPEEVIVSALTIATLPHEQILSGYAEMLKTAVISDLSLYEELLEPSEILENIYVLERLMKRCIEIKDSIVKEDPYDNGLRKILNFGHTAGHAIESLLIEEKRPVPHGVAVAYGMLVELYISGIVKDFPRHRIEQYSRLISDCYPQLPIGERHIERILKLMYRDKKNAVHGIPNFTLLKDIGVPVLNCYPDVEIIKKGIQLLVGR